MLIFLPKDWRRNVNVSRSFDVARAARPDSTLSSPLWRTSSPQALYLWSTKHLPTKTPRLTRNHVLRSTIQFTLKQSPRHTFPYLSNNSEIIILCSKLTSNYRSPVSIELMVNPTLPPGELGLTSSRLQRPLSDTCVAFFFQQTCAYLPML